jgi:hypothetical protein
VETRVCRSTLNRYWTHFSPWPLKHVHTADLAATLAEMEADEASSEADEYTVDDAADTEDHVEAAVNRAADDITVGGWSLCPAKLLAKLVKLYNIRPDELPSPHDAGSSPNNKARLILCLHIDETVWKAGRKLERVGIRIMNYCLAGKRICCHIMLVFLQMHTSTQMRQRCAYYALTSYVYYHHSMTINMLQEVLMSPRQNDTIKAHGDEDIYTLAHFYVEKEDYISMKV